MKTETILTVIVIILIVISIIAVAKIMIIKAQLKSIKYQLTRTEAMDYDKQVRVELVDKDLTELAGTFNHNLDYQKSLKLKAEQSENALKQSIADISHDLRTPLTVVDGNLQLLSKEDGISESGRAYIETCMRQTDNLREMVDSFFELSLLESEDTIVELKETDLTKALIDFVIDHEGIIRSHGIEPVINLPEKEIKIMADEKLLQRIFSNLLNNIVKYASENFWLTLTESDTEITVVFSNNIESESTLDPSRLFDRTYRGTKERKGSGAGLGLFIVKLLCDRQSIDVFADIRDEKDERGLKVRRLNIRLRFSKC